jgi:hypothetical protein
MDPLTRGASIIMASLALSLLLPGVSSASELKAAEYAIRWDTVEGGPKTVGEVLEVLGKDADDTDKYTIQYFELKAPEDAPEGFKAILRQRQKKNKYELTFKYRGDRALSSWTCPLAEEPAESKAEVDVSVVGDEIKRAFSYSCTIESVGLPIPPPEALGAVPKLCTSKMTRTKAGKLKVEEWALPGGVTMIEVSKNGEVTDDDPEGFRKKVVEKLVDKGIKPSDRSKTELGGTCP